MSSIFNKIEKKVKARKPQLAVLIDPDKFNKELIPLANVSNVDYFFVGGSELKNGDLKKTISAIKRNSTIPIIIFPGDTTQISGKADAILFLSLISGRNADYLIDMQVKSAPIIKKKKLESISTGYILIESGSISTTQKVSKTKPIPATSIDLAIATAIAGEMMGMKMIYLEAGSGSKKNVPIKLIQSVKKHISIPLVVGGGISSAKQAKQLIAAGADILVVGNALEKDITLLTDLKKIFN